MEMKKGLIVAAVVVLTVSGVGRAGTGSAMGDLGVTLDATWVSKYIWNGFDKLDDKAAFQPSVTLDLFDSGFTVGVWGSWAGASGDRNFSTVNATELDYIVGWSGTLNPGERTQVDIGLSWIYYDFIDEPSNVADAQSVVASIALPQLTGFGLVPRYTAQYFWPAEGGGPSNDVTGWIHRFGLDYNLVVGEIIPNNPEQVFTFGWDITYNDGAGLAGTSDALGTDVDHDWSHMTWSVVTEIGCPWGGTFRPGLYYQTSMDDSVNDEDELWTGLSYTLEF
jgi:hypothetical protein